MDAIHDLPPGVDAVVSLCRLGRGEASAVGVAAGDHIEMWLTDSADPAGNPHLDFVLLDAARAVADLRAEGRTVLLHCVQAQSRTPTVAALRSAINCGVPADQALRDVRGVLPDANPNPAFRNAIERLAGNIHDSG